MKKMKSPEPKSKKLRMMWGSEFQTNKRKEAQMGQSKFEVLEAWLRNGGPVPQRQDYSKSVYELRPPEHALFANEGLDEEEMDYISKEYSDYEEDVEARKLDENEKEAEEMRKREIERGITENSQGLRWKEKECAA